MAPRLPSSSAAVVRRNKNHLKSKASSLPSEDSALSNHSYSHGTSYNDDIEAASEPLHHRNVPHLSNNSGLTTSSSKNNNNNNNNKIKHKGFHLQNGRSRRVTGKNPRRTSRVVCCGVLPVDLPVVGALVFLLIAGVVLVGVARTTLDLHKYRSTSTDKIRGGDAHDSRARNRWRNEQRLLDGSDRSEHESPFAPGHAHDKKKRNSKRKEGEWAKDHPQAAAFSVSPVRLVRRENHTGETVDYDVVVAGAGPAGLTAALFAARSGLKVYVLGSPATGLLSQTKILDNFPSFSDSEAKKAGKSSAVRSGPEWLKTTLAQAKSWGATFGPPGLLATSLERQRIATQEDDPGSETDSSPEQKDVYFAIKTAEDHATIRAWSMVIASGATPRSLGLSGEDKLWGVSLHSCAICDGHLYSSAGSDHRKTVVVVGGGDAALDAALLLARYDATVILVHRRNEFSRVHNLANLEIARSTPNIQILTPYTVERWITDETEPSRLVGVRLTKSGGNGEATTRTVKIDGAFVAIGAVPNTQWIKDTGINLDGEGLIQTNLSPGEMPMVTATSVPGLFAAGEVTDKIYKQAITAAAAGAQAGMDAERWLREQRGIVLRTTGTKTPDRSLQNKSGKDPVSDLESNTDGSNNHPRDADNCDLTLQDCIESIVRKYPVVVFSKPWCPYCRKALEALSLAGVSVENNQGQLLVVDLSKHANTQEIQSTLQAMTGRRTVPNVFVGGKSIGGGDETHGFQQRGELVPMLQEANALRMDDSNKNKDSNNDNQTDGSKKLSGATTGIQKTEKIDEQVKIQKAKPQLSHQYKPKKDQQKHNDSDGWHSSSKTEPCDLALESCVRTVVEKYPILLFSLSWCPECVRSLELLDRIGISKDQIHIIDLDDYKPIARDIRGHMYAIAKRTSVPNLFVGGEFVGGYYQTKMLHEAGGLVSMFRGVGALPE